MSEPFLAEIKIVGFNFAQRGWAFCSGQLLPINQNQALFSLLGTIYGGNGTTTFALPDMRGRVPVHASGGFSLGERSGTETHTLSAAEMPAHSHQLMAASGNADSRDPAGRALGRALNVYADPEMQVATQSGTVAAVGGSPHTNMQPFLAAHFLIALQGIFPSPS